MKNKFKLFLPLSGIVAVIGMASTAAAFDGGCERGHRFEGGRHGNVIERMKDELNLNDDQASQIRAIIRENREARKEQRQDRRAMRMAMRQLDPSSADYMQQVDKLAQQQAEAVKEKIKAHARVRKEIHAVLTPEQREKARQLRQQRMERQRERRESGERLRNDKRS